MLRKTSCFLSLLDFWEPDRKIGLVRPHYWSLLFRRVPPATPQCQVYFCQKILCWTWYDDALNCTAAAFRGLLLLPSCFRVSLNLQRRVVDITRLQYIFENETAVQEHYRQNALPHRILAAACRKGGRPSHPDWHEFSHLNRCRLSHGNKSYICHLRLHQYPDSLKRLRYAVHGQLDDDLECLWNKHTEHVLLYKNTTGRVGSFDNHQGAEWNGLQ